MKPSSKIEYSYDSNHNIQRILEYWYNEEKQEWRWESPDTAILTYIVSLYNYRNDIYTSKNKKLIRLTDYIYSTNNINIKYGYNGVLSYDGVIIYNDNGYILAASADDNKSSYKSMTISENIQYLPNGTNLTRIHPISYITFPVYDEYFHESKVINNEPKIYYNFVADPSKENARKWEGSFVEPINSIDLFKNPQGSISDFYPITNTNYREDLVNVTQFDKTVRRSNVIQDETRINAWRQFPIEGYKNITENEFLKLDSRVNTIIKSEITRFTIPLITEYDLYNQFCEKGAKEEIVFDEKSILLL